MHDIERPWQFKMKNSGEVLTSGYEHAKHAVETGVADMIGPVDVEHAKDCTCGPCRNAQPVYADGPGNYPAPGSANYQPLEEE